MPVSPSFPAPGFPEFPQAGEPRHDAVSPNLPEFPHRFPQPVPPPPLEGRGSGETPGNPSPGHPEVQAKNDNLLISSQPFARDGGALMNTNNSLIPAGLPDWLSAHVEEVAGWGPTPVARGCWVVGCRRDAHLLGLCKTHHRRAERAWKPRPSDSGRWRNESTGRKYGRKTQPEGPSRLETTD